MIEMFWVDYSYNPEGTALITLGYHWLEEFRKCISSTQLFGKEPPM